MASRLYRSVLAWAVAAILLFAFWLLLVDSIEAAQLYTGIVAAALAASGFELVRSRRDDRLRARPAWLLGAWRPLARVPLDLALLCREAALAALGRQPRGARFRALPFEPGGGGPLDNARHALAEIAGSFSPNTYVVGVDVARRALLVHQLVAEEDEPAKTIDPLGLR